MDREKLIKYYEKMLEKVKKAHSYNKNDTELKKDKCKEYIFFAEKQLKEVQNGRNW